MLKIGAKYLLRFEINERFLIYTATVLEDDGVVIKFRDREGKEFYYNKSKLISAEGLEDD